MTSTFVEHVACLLVENNFFSNNTILRQHDMYSSNKKKSYIKGNRTKHISPKLFYTHDLEKNDDIYHNTINFFNDNLTDLFTNHYLLKSLKNRCITLEYDNLEISCHV